MLTQYPGIAEIGGLQAALDAKASLSGAAFTGACSWNTGVALTADAPLSALTQQWNNAAVEFSLRTVNVVATACNGYSKIENWKNNGTTVLAIDQSGYLFKHSTSGMLKCWDSGCYSFTQANVPTDHYVAVGYGVSGVSVASGFGYFFSNASANAFATRDTALQRASAGVLEVTNGTAGIANRATLAAGAVKPRAGTSTGSANAGGTLAVDTTQTANVGSGVDTLQTYSVPANTLAANGDAIAFRFSGVFADTANAKQIVLKFGATTIVETRNDTAYGSGGPTWWRLVGTIIRTGAATQKCEAVFTFDGFDNTGPIVRYVAAAETLSGAVTLLLTGEGVDNNDIVKEIFTLQYEPAP